MMLETLSIFIRLVAVALSLFLVGEPFRILLSRYTTLFREMDTVQTFVVDFYLGGLVFYAIAMTPLQLFSFQISLGILLACTLSSLVIYARKVAGFFSDLKEHFRLNRKQALKITFVFGMFLSLFFLEIVPTTNFVFGNVYDSSLFGLFAQLIIRNQQAPVTMQPFGTEGIIYPQGFFAIEAFACNLFGFSAAEISLKITPLFMALAVLGAYFLGRSFSPNSPLDLSLAFTFFCISRWPRLLLWGSNAFVAGFALYLIALGLLPKLRKLQKNPFLNRRDLATFVMIGIIFGYLAAIHLVFFELLFVMTVIYTLFILIKERKSVLLKLGGVVLFCLVSLVPISVSIYRFVAWHPYPGNNIGLPSDVVIRSEEWVGGVPLSVVLQRLAGWVFYSDWISPHVIVLFGIVELLLFGTSAVILLRKHESFSKVREIFKLSLVVPAIALPMILLTTNEMLLLVPQLTQFAMITVQIAEMAILAISALFIALGAYNVLIIQQIRKIARSSVAQTFSGTNPKASTESAKTSIMKIKKPATVALLLSLLIVSVIYAPFVSSLVTADLAYANGQYNMFCVTTQDDYQLMLWMRGQLPSDSAILVSPYDSGGFIPIVAGYKVIYSAGASRYSLRYTELVEMLSNNNLSIKTYDLLRGLNITHVFVGSTISPGHARWDPQLFLGNPNFRTVRNIGNAYLFQVKDHPNPNDIFVSDFEQGDINADGWNSSTSSLEGSGSVNLVQTNDASWPYSLKISAQRVRSEFWCSIFRRVYLPTDDTIFLSFHVNLTEGFDKTDNLLIIVADSNWTSKLFFNTLPSRKLTSSTILPMTNGNFTVNLSERWSEVYNSSLPKSLYLQISNVDTDGVQNVAYVDTVKLWSANRSIDNVQFWEDFRGSTLNSSGWLASYNGSGNGALTQSKEGLDIYSQGRNNAYWFSISKPIELFENSSSVKLRIQLDATRGFSYKDAFAIVITDNEWKQQLRLSTNPGVILTECWIQPTGTQEINLTELWNRTFHSVLPEKLQLQIINVDRDGVQNIAHLNLLEFLVSSPNSGSEKS